MILILFCAVLLIGGLILAKTHPDIFEDDYCLIGQAIAVCSGVVLGVLLLIIAGAQIPGPGQKAEAEATIQWIESLSANPQIQQSERENALAWYQRLAGNLAINRAYRDSPWIGWFFYHGYGDVELPPLSCIPPAKAVQGIELSGLEEVRP